MNKIEGIPEGYELVRIGAIDPESQDEYGMEPNGTVFKAFSQVWRRDINYPILRKLKSWRPAKPSDLDSGPVKARFRNSEREDWLEGMFTGWLHLFHNYQKDNDIYCMMCEVEE